MAATGPSKRIGERCRRAAAAAGLCVALAGCGQFDTGGAPVMAASTALLSEDEAVEKAVSTLRNTDYGEGRIDVLNHIKTKVLMTSGRTACGAIVRPVWAFQVRAQFEGWLYLDAATGEKACSSLPFLR